MQPKAFNPRSGNEDIFWYGATVTGLQSTAPTGSALINIDSDADFYCIALSYQASILTGTLGNLVTEATNVIPLVTLQINDTGSGKSLSNIPLPIGTMLGDGKRPYRLPRPRVFLANATINMNFASFVVAGTIYQITVALGGYKVYKA